MVSFKSFEVHYLWPAEEVTNWALENHFFSIAEGLLPKPIPFVISDGSSDGEVAADIQSAASGHNIDCLCGLPVCPVKNQAHTLGSISILLTGSAVLKT